MLTKRLLITIIAINLIFISIAYSQQPSSISPAQSPQAQSLQLTPQQSEILQKATPEQQMLIQKELQKTGGILTPEAIETLKSQPEFQGLTPEDIMKGKEALEKKEIEKKETSKELSKAVEKTVIGEGKEATIFERYRETGKYQDISTVLKPFGYEFFREAAVRILTERKDIPVPSEYIVGPGDEIKILLWGRVNAQYNPVVDRDGNITIPQIGPLHVAGMTYEQMASHLITQAGQIVGANINVTMGSLKSIPIFVLGDVKRPGAYTIGSFATITDALLFAGGPTDIGTMRNIQLKRKDKLITIFDLYDLLLKGDKSKDRILQAGDIIFVPVSGPIVGIAGNVKRPAIYELKDKNDLMTLIDLAGGIIPTAYTQQIQVERIVKNERQIVVDIDDKDLSRAKDFMLQDADLIKVFPIVDRDMNVVYLNGNVKRPGKYEFKIGMKVKDLIKDTTELLEETHFEYALIKRLMPPDLRTELIPFNLGRLLLDNDDTNNIELQPQDNIYIFSKWFFKDKPFITVEGEVRKGGGFSLAENMRVKDAILTAGDLTKDAYLQKGEIIRVDNKRQYQTIYFNVEMAMANDPIENLLLQDEDRVIIHSIKGWAYDKIVSAYGDVLNPGTYKYTDGMTVRDLVFKAGNILESAYLDEAEVSSQIIEEGRIVRIDHKKINLRKALEGDTEHNVQLRPYDRLFVKRLSDWRKETFVNITGEVLFPGRYILKKGERLSSIIERAGGYTKDAYLKGAVFIREKVRELQQKQIDEMVDRLERELLAAGAREITVTLTPEDAKAKEAEIKYKKEFIARLKQAKAKGRMAIKIDQPELLKKTPYDIELEDGDSLFIPSNPQSVQVVGSVYNQTAFLYDKDKNSSGYIELAGGYTENADKSRVYILKADGTAIGPGGGFLGISWSKSSKRWEFGSQDIEPGDTIVVPERLERIAWMRQIKDLTQILYQIAVTAGVLIVAF